jgi:hypothetical protein
MNKKWFTAVHESGESSALEKESKLVADTNSGPQRMNHASDSPAVQVSEDLNLGKLRKPAIIALILAGALLLLSSYIADSIVLMFIGLGLILWGMLLLYVTQSKYVPDEIVTAITFSPVRSVDALVRSYGYNGRAIFLYPKTLKGMDEGYVFIPANEEDDEEKIPVSENLIDEKVLQDAPKGLLLPAPSQSLASYFERKLSVNFATTNLPTIQEKIPSLLVENLRIADNVSLVKSADGETFTLRIQGGPWAGICNRINSQTQIGSHLGCPLCGAFALILSKVNSIPIRIKQTETSHNHIETVYQSVIEK